MSSENMLDVASAHELNTRQRLFLRYFTAILIDLVVLNLFAEFWDKVSVASFSISLAAAILLQLLLKATLHIEHLAANYFSRHPSGFAKFMRYFSAWAILFASKFIILGAINFAFGDAVAFSGALHGIVAFIAVVMVMLLAEELIVRFYQRLS